MPTGFTDDSYVIRKPTKSMTNVNVSFENIFKKQIFVLWILFGCPPIKNNTIQKYAQRSNVAQRLVSNTSF